MPQEKVKILKVPNSDVPLKVGSFLGDSDLVRVCVIRDGPETSTIEATFKS